MSGWGCPHEDKGACARRRTPCDPGSPECVLEGRLPAPERPCTPDTPSVQDALPPRPRGQRRYAARPGPGTEPREKSLGT